MARNFSPGVFASLRARLPEESAPCGMPMLSRRVVRAIQSEGVKVSTAPRALSLAKAPLEAG